MVKKGHYQMQNTILNYLLQAYEDWKTLELTRKFIIAVDCDSTLFEDRFPYTGKPIRNTIEACRFMRQYSDVEIVMWSCRNGQSLINAIEACENEGIPCHQYNQHSTTTLSEFESMGITTTRKLLADVYIDDLAFNITYLSHEYIEQLITERYNQWVLLSESETVEPYFAIGVDYDSIVDSYGDVDTTTVQLLKNLNSLRGVRFILWHNVELNSHELDIVKHAGITFTTINTDIPEIIDYWLTKCYTASPKISTRAFIDTKGLNPHALSE